MVTDVKELIGQCEQELTSREYAQGRLKIITGTWRDLMEWMVLHACGSFNEDIGFQYCNETFGSCVLSGIEKKDQLRLRAVRMLISYQKDGDFEFRTPTMLYRFSGKSGNIIEKYLEHLKNTVCLSENTLSNKRQYLLAFNAFLESHFIELNEIKLDTVADFYSKQSYTLASKHNCNSTLRLFLRHTYDNGMTELDCSIYILPDNYNKRSRIPTTYEEQEIRNILAAVERTSVSGKRDYLILLLACEYGFRSSDIVNLRFDQIDWDKNIISFNQHKTSIPVEYPLLASVGNAIIDYLKNGRPDTDTPEIIVSNESAKRGKKLCKTTIHSIVAKYMRLANISHWKEKKHGAHSLRHSLATNLLKKNIPISIISTILGHQNTESTKGYLAIDINRLRECPLPIPALATAFYEV